METGILDGAHEANETIARLCGEWSHNPDVMERAAELAVLAHHGQRRKSGDPYVTHPLAVAEIVASWGMDQQSVVAALLHDVVEDTDVELTDIHAAFGDEVSQLVDGLTKLDGVKLVETAAGVDSQAAQNLQKLLLAVAEDPRVLVVKLADRLHNIRTLGALPAQKAARIARETMDVHAPLAQRLGMSEVAGELEDLCFEILYPQRFAELKRQVEARLEDGRARLEQMHHVIKGALSEAAIDADVSARVKRLWSVYEKMVVKHRNLDQVYDLAGIRILVDTTPECYAALGVVHGAFQPVPGRFKDWLSSPKLNMYQSLHTTVLAPGGLPVEVQIRTREMHRRAEWGVAAHWRYKFEDAMPRTAESLLQRLGSIAEKGGEGFDPTAFFEHLRSEIGGDQIYCFTPAGDVIELPNRATCVDFAYAVHTEIGNTCVGAKVNGRMVPLATELYVGDRVEILTSKRGVPKGEWLSFAVSAKARGRIRHRLEKERSVQEAQRVPEALVTALSALGMPQRVMRPGAIDSTAKALGCADSSDLFEKVQTGQVDAVEVAHLLSGVAGVSDPAEAPQADTTHEHIAVEGGYAGSCRTAKCCRPVYGDPIVGFVVGRGVVEVHRAGCAGVQRQGDAPRAVEVAWDGSGPEIIVEVRVDAIDREGLLADVAQTFADRHIAIVSSSTATGRDMVARERFRVRVADLSHLDVLLESLRGVEGVFSAERS